MRASADVENLLDQKFDHLLLQVEPQDEKAYDEMSIIDTFIQDGVEPNHVFQARKKFRRKK
ncbi:MAG: uncharacterized protein KVP18_002608 [Porospora cf. gigantea A]|uniref:uncharacterized protein n=1 Tax=Porospora cf. gigantea A TaxID=2853593 RepID=UPI003559745A|nr:MAG: hypothetical protein KVP18_002608 [Porospora cf. gigantea A]